MDAVMTGCCEVDDGKAHKFPVKPTKRKGAEYTEWNKEKWTNELIYVDFFWENCGTWKALCLAKSKNWNNS